MQIHDGGCVCISCYLQLSSHFCLINIQLSLPHAEYTQAKPQIHLDSTVDKPVAVGECCGQQVWTQSSKQGLSQKQVQVCGESSVRANNEILSALMSPNSLHLLLSMPASLSAACPCSINTAMTVAMQ